MKFVISAAQREALMEKVGPHLRADANADETAYYPIISLYYDTPERDCYWDKARSLSNRRKFRVRVYGSLDGKLPPTVFIEIKHKADDRGVKRRARLPLEEAMRVGEGKWPNVELDYASKRVVAEVIEDLVLRRGFAPTMLMRYDRRAYASVDPESDLRITYDTDILYRLDNLIPVPDDRRFDPNNRLHPEGTSVLELKISGCVPYWLTKMIGETGCLLVSHSKYSIALERSDPVLRKMLVPSYCAKLPPLACTKVISQKTSSGFAPQIPMLIPALA
ncbi:MAG: polyphosphate polymerase domain-containing protein [Verrucomicrobiota bacterium]